MKDVHETERYAPINDFPDYLITSYGRVFSLKYGKLKELKPRINKYGYLDVMMYKNGKQYRKTKHFVFPHRTDILESLEQPRNHLLPLEI